MTRLFFTRFFCLLTCLTTVAAHADKLDDDLQTVWESLWDQRGTPRQVIRWDKPIWYRLHGTDTSRHRAHIENALQAVSGIARLELVDVSAQADAEAVARLDIEIVNDRALQDNEPCNTQPVKWSNWVYEKVRVKMRSHDTWRCTFHEMMHVMGIAGHPSGKTVLSYFAHRRDRLMDLDQLMLEAWYSPAMPRGATPLEALVVLTDAVARQGNLGLSSEDAQGRTKLFNQRMLAQMESLAMGQGEVPSIVLRSGKASQEFIDNSQRITTYFVGLAYLKGVIAPKDTVASSEWFKRSAHKGYSPGQVMWGRALRDGLSVQPDKPTAHAWFTLAGRNGNAVGSADLAALEKTLTPEELEKARGQLPPTLNPS